MSVKMSLLNQNQLHNTIVQAMAEQDIKVAINACRLLNSHYPNYFEGWYLAGQIHDKLRKPLAGLVSTERALLLKPNEPKVTLQRINCFFALDRMSEGRALLTKLSANNLNGLAINTTNEQVDILDKTAMLLTSVDLHDEALQQYHQAILIAPSNAALYYNLATALRFLGKTSLAVDALDKCLSINPLDFEAQGMRSSLTKQTIDDNHIEQLKALLVNNALPSEGRININFALAKECDDVDQTELSFKFLKEGTKLRRQQMSYKVAVDTEIITAIKTTFNSSMLSRNVIGNDSSEPIFILGLPRTGTTLVERILSSHSAVFSAGELDNFGREMSRLAANNSASDTHKLSRSQLVTNSATINFAQLGENYLQSTRPLTGHTERFIDKLPFNYLYAGLIHLALPNAKIINMKRHPMAACFAIYKQLFRDAYPFSYDFNDLAQYYIAYHQLMEHWQQVMPDVIYSIQYENVIADLDSESKKLVEFCQLPWQSQCLRFYENKQASTTASASQVRQPIYNSSVNRWRLYAKQLAPLQEMLEEAGIDTR
jgi:tetratricopeptide (TPR) repeat protein